MKIKFNKKIPLVEKNLMRKCGYALKVTRQGKVSYVRRLRGGEFPRFHAYVDVRPESFQINVHLDQKGACYKGTNAHSGEYDSDLVEQEADYIKRMVASLFRHNL